VTSGAIPVLEVASASPGAVELVVLAEDMPEFRRAVMHRLRINLIKDQMRQDLEDLLDGFAARWGMTR
jgi:hypothetical protein